MKIFLINLAQRSDRLAFMEDQLSALGLPFTRIEAVDGLGDAEIAYPANHSRLSKAEFACYLSHVKCWEAFLATDESHCLILEDDVVLAKSLPQILAHKAFFDHNGKLTRLECRIWRTRVSKTWRHRFNGRKLRRITAYDGGAGALVITRDYAAYLLAQHATPEIPVDDVLLDPTQTRYRPKTVYQLDPAPATQSIFLEDSEDTSHWRSDLQTTRVKPGKPREPRQPLAAFATEATQLGRNIRTNLLDISKVIPFRDD